MQAELRRGLRFLKPIFHAPCQKSGIIVKFQFHWQPVQNNKTKALLYKAVKINISRQSFTTSFRINGIYDLNCLVQAVNSTNRTALLIVIARRMGYLVVTNLRISQCRIFQLMIVNHNILFQTVIAITGP